MLVFILLTALAAANTTAWPDYYGEYYGYGGKATSDVDLIECTYRCNPHLYFQCAMTIDYSLFSDLNRKNLSKAKTIKTDVALEWVKYE